LFPVLGGVKTGCPASSILFLLGLNPIVDLFTMLCESPKLSITRICADDFGSCLSNLAHIRTHDSIFHLASQVAGLHLKPEKCVIVVSGVPLTDHLKEAIREWLRTHVPRFSSFKIADSGKYLGVWLGRNLVNNTLQAPRD